MGVCRLCHRKAADISETLAVCLHCIRERPATALVHAMEAHARCRAAFALPAHAPRAEGGAPCRVCLHECRIPLHAVGYCGLRRNEAGEVKEVSAEWGKRDWYYDALPPNCVADWVCAGCTGTGYPAHARSPGPEYGYKNLAVFFQACSFDCLFCQNWQFRLQTLAAAPRPVEDLVAAIRGDVGCVCFFGGDPAPQLPYSLRAAQLARRRLPGRILRFCWETSGSMHPGLLDEVMEVALESGGCVKFDLKGRDDNLHRALTGVGNGRTLENFARAGARIAQRRAPRPLVASTLLVPGYVDVDEVRALARVIASVDRDIPYSLLGFHPHFYMGDLPTTSRRLAEECRAAAMAEGLANVHLANVHLLA